MPPKGSDVVIGGGGDLSQEDIDTIAELNVVLTDADVDDLSALRTPTTHAASHATAGGDDITPAAIGATSSADFGTHTGNTSAHHTRYTDGEADARVAAGTSADTVTVDGTAAATVAAGAAAGATALQPADMPVWHSNETIASENVTGTDTVLGDTLDYVPSGSVLLICNGVTMLEGAGNDFTISGQTITWLADTGTAPDLTLGVDDLRIFYGSAGAPGWDAIRLAASAEKTNDTTYTGATAEMTELELNWTATAGTHLLQTSVSLTKTVATGPVRMYYNLDGAGWVQYAYETWYSGNGGTLFARARLTLTAGSRNLKIGISSTNGSAVVYGATECPSLATIEVL